MNVTPSKPRPSGLCPNPRYAHSRTPNLRYGCESPYFLLQHLRECLTKTNAHDSWQLLFVSDGSATKQTMSFGWKLVSSDETPLAVNRGPAWGPPGSFRAEAYGMLSAVLLCVHHIMLYCNATDSVMMKLVTDNKGLLIRCQQHMQYPDSFPTATLPSG
jgi:hypothetical protein